MSGLNDGRRNASGAAAPGDPAAQPPHEGERRPQPAPEIEFLPEIEALYSAAPVGLAVIDRERRIIRMNRAMERIAVAPAPDWLGRRSREAAARIRPLIQRVIDTGRPALGVEVSGGTPDDERHLLVNYAPVRDAAGAVAAVQCAVQDISARKRHEKSLAEALAQKDILVREMSHRLVNGFQMIASLLHLQKRAIADAEARKALDMAERRVHAMALAHRRLYQSDGGPDAVDLSDYLGGLCEDLRQALTADGDRVALTVAVAPDLHVSMDRAVTIGLLVTELVTNACKYAFRPGEAGTIRVGYAPHDGGCRLTVADDGRGLPPDFDPEAAGGLGMAIVLGQVRQLGGHLEIDRTPPGARFAVTVPA